MNCFKLHFSCGMVPSPRLHYTVISVFGSGSIGCWNNFRRTSCLYTMYCKEYMRTCWMSEGGTSKTVVYNRDVLGSKIPRTWTALNMSIRQYFEPFKGKTKYWYKALEPSNKPIQVTCLIYSYFFCQNQCQNFPTVGFQNQISVLLKFCTNFVSTGI